MKKILSLLIVLSGFNVYADSDNPKKNVKPVIKEVTVFLNRAQVISTSSATLGEGLTDIVMEGLPTEIDPQSIQISGKGDFMIMAVKSAVNYLNPIQKSKEIILLEDSIETCQTLLDSCNNLQDVLTKEEQLIIANQSLRGENGSISGEGLDNYSDALEDMADLYRERLLQIRNLTGKNKKSIQKLTTKLTALKNQLNTIITNRNRASMQVTVTVSAKEQINAQFRLDYIVSSAGWYPIYDLRARDTKNPVQLSYKAQVYQNTGIDWENVKLKLSTMNPSQSGTKPTLSPMYVNVYDPVYYKNKKSGRSESAPKSSRYYSVDEIAGEETENEKDATTVAIATQTVETTLAAEFAIAVLYTVKSGKQGQLVDIMSKELPAYYVHSAAPKLDKDAFLLARITEWESLNMLSGEANIYFEGTYVGKSFLDMQITRDTLDISLGRDKKVVIERKSLSEFTSKKLIGTNRKEEYAYEISIRNTKKDPVEIIIEDQYPVSQNSQVEVEVLDNGGAQVDPVTGKMTWKFTINPAETRKAIFKYSVKYPKGKSISGM